MCSGAIVLFKIPRVVIGEAHTFSGELDLLRSRGVEVMNLKNDSCIDMMTEYISHYPELWNEDIGVQ